MMPRDEWKRSRDQRRYGAGNARPRNRSDSGVECPKCGEWMVRRTNAVSGEAFWGCHYYPECRGTRPGDYPVPPRAKKPKKKKRKGRQRNPHVTEADRHMASLGVANLLAKAATLAPPTPHGQDQSRPAARTARGEVVF